MNRRGQACEVLADTGISHRFKMVRTAGNAPAYSCSRSRRLTFRLRSDKLPSALNLMSGHYFDRARSLPVDRVQLGEMVEHLGIAPSIPAWKAGVYLSTPMLGKWSPVRELHPPKRFCRPLPGLLGQRDFGLNAIRGETNPRAEPIEPLSSQPMRRTAAGKPAGLLD